MTWEAITSYQLKSIELWTLYIVHNWFSKKAIRIRFIIYEQRNKVIYKLRLNSSTLMDAQVASESNISPKDTGTAEFNWSWIHWDATSLLVHFPLPFSILDSFYFKGFSPLPYSFSTDFSVLSEIWKWCANIKFLSSSLQCVLELFLLSNVPFPSAIFRCEMFGGCHRADSCLSFYIL